MEDPRFTPPPIPEDTPPEKKRPAPNQGSNWVMVGIGFIVVSIIGEISGTNNEKYVNLSYATGAVTVKLFLFGLGAFLVLRGIRIQDKMKTTKRLFLTGAAFLFICVYVAAFSFGLSSRFEDEGLISQIPLVNVTKAISLLSLIAAMLYFIKGFRLMNPDK